MSDKLPKAIFGAEDRPLSLGGFEIPCYVLEDGKRVLIQGGMIRALDMKQGTAGRGGGDRLAKFIATKGINPFVSDGLSNVIKNPIKFRTTKGSLAYGYEATILADLCDAVLDARKAQKLHYQQSHIASQCEILVRGFARVGIVALVDEVTGYQETRDKDTLRAILEAYLRKELAAWAKRFPDDFYKEMFRLRNWQWKGMSVNRPSIVGHYTNDLIYDRLAPSILKELESKNPKDETTGRRKARHHQWLTDDVGHPALAQHLHAVIGLMRASATWAQFYRLIQRAFPKKGETIPLPIDIG